MLLLTCALSQYNSFYLFYSFQKSFTSTCNVIHFFQYYQYSQLLHLNLFVLIHYANFHCMVLTSILLPDLNPHTYANYLLINSIRVIYRNRFYIFFYSSTTLLRSSILRTYKNKIDLLGFHSSNDTYSIDIESFTKQFLLFTLHTCKMK